ncbi:hypothetical protein CTI14_49035 [Methylobacterium radiotolerans]|nr:hypothetical protein CTI14_49035 [Methylobacterium radiotolerans]
MNIGQQAQPNFNVNAPGLKHDPFWYKKAVFYEVLVRASTTRTETAPGTIQGLIDRLAEPAHILHVRR